MAARRPHPLFFLAAVAALSVARHAPAADWTTAKPSTVYMQRTPSWASAESSPITGSGFHTERRYRAGLLVPGAVMTIVGIVFLAQGVSGSASRDEDIRRSREPGNSSLEEVVREHESDSAFTTIGGAHLIVGLPLLTLGILFPRYVLVPNRVAFAPVLGASRAGGELRVTF